jgi:hypothetical protein
MKLKINYQYYKNQNFGKKLKAHDKALLYKLYQY